jgi:predicted peroxiredoxin
VCTIVTQTDAETVFNALHLALHSLEQGDRVRIFLSGKGVDIDKIDDPKFEVEGQARKVLDAGGQFLACGGSSRSPQGLSIGCRSSFSRSRPPGSTWPAPGKSVSCSPR